MHRAIARPIGIAIIVGLGGGLLTLPFFPSPSTTYYMGLILQVMLFVYLAQAWNLAGGLAVVFKGARARQGHRVQHPCRQGQTGQVAGLPDFFRLAKTGPHIGLAGHALFKLGNALRVAAGEAQNQQQWCPQ